MPQPQNAMQIFQLLDKSNCRECGEKTCLAFAGAVFMGTKQLAQCPKLDPETIARFGGNTAESKTVEEERDETMRRLQSRVAEIDLAAAAKRIGADFAGDRLTLKVLGKNFSVDTGGPFQVELDIDRQQRRMGQSRVSGSKHRVGPCRHSCAMRKESKGT